MEFFVFGALLYFILYLLIFFSVIREDDKKAGKNINAKSLKKNGKEIKANFPLMLIYIVLISLAKLYVATLNGGFTPPTTGISTFAGMIASLLSFEKTSAAFYMVAKVIAIIAEAVTAAVVYKFAIDKDFGHKKAQAISTALLLFAPLVGAGAGFGWTTSVTVMFVVLALIMADKENYLAGGILFGLAGVCEMAGIILAVVYFIYLVLNKDKKSSLIYIGSAVATVLVVPLVLALNNGIAEGYKAVFALAQSYSYVAASLFSGIGGSGQVAKLFGDIVTAIVAVLVIVATVLISKKSDKEDKLYYILALVGAIFAVLASGQNALTLTLVAGISVIGYIKTKDSLFALSFFVTGVISSVTVALKYIYTNGTVASSDTTLIIISWLAVLTVIAFAVLVVKKCVIGETAKKLGNSKVSFKNTSYSAQQTMSAPTSYQFQRSDLKTKILRIDALLMAVLMLTYGLLAFTNLGTTVTPQTEYQPLQTNSSFDVSFVEPADVARVYMFTTWIDRRTSDNNVIRDVEVLASYDGGATYTKATDMKFQDVLRWRYVPLNLTGVTNIRFNVNDEPRFVLNEMVFYDSAQNIVEVAGVRDVVGSGDSVKNLFDEQETAVYDPTWYHGSYFDEIYHPRTAYEHIHHYEMYENSHPPLGKLMMSLGILIFGLCPFGWRFFGVFFAMMMIPVVYILAKKMFKQTKWAFIAAALLVFDCMTTAQARLATIDTYVTFYIILMTLFMYSYYTKSFYDTKLSKTLVPLGLCGLAFGLGVASKWTGLYAGVGLAIVFFINFGKRCYEYYIACTDKKHTENNGISYEHVRKVFPKYATITILFAILMFVIVPAVIYVAAYIPYFLIPKPNHDFAAFMRLQNHMFNYHSGLTATHPYASKWYQWPAVYRPMLYATQTAEFRTEGMKYGIASFGNPLIWWMTFPCILGSALVALKRKWNKEMTVTFTMFMAIWLLWSGISRNVFIYHFFTNTPLLMLWIVWFMKFMDERFRVPAWIFWVYLVAVIVIYLMFYPVLVGMEVPTWYIDDVLEWFPTWVLG